MNDDYGVPERREGILAAIGRGLRSAVLPVLFLAACGYFIWHAVHGERGLIASEQRLQLLADARQELERSRAELESWERRVQGMRGDRLDRDQLDERARQLLNFVGKDELVVPYGPERRLF
ncbi:FtsB family cell division protein [Falsiroseomonas ponticola]|uniref:FtsB family cell division protein n=1 Tax=Falsiroseomonas ponticola TaxID=2786951 RepID=UPI00299D619B|nr:septum formation initiator family protein [Roseomonas ponticola]